MQSTRIFNLLTQVAVVFHLVLIRIYSGLHIFNFRQASLGHSFLKVVDTYFS